MRDGSPRIIPEWARRAEEAGFSSLGTVGRIAYPGVMDTIALAAAAGATERIGLLSNVLLGTVWSATLLAKEVAGIDGVSGERLTLGIGIGGRPDDFVADGLGPSGLGKRIDADLETYRSVWRGEPVGGGDNAAVPPGTRQVPMLFGGFAPAALGPGEPLSRRLQACCHSGHGKRTWAAACLWVTAGEPQFPGRSGTGMARPGGHGSVKTRWGSTRWPTIRLCGCREGRELNDSQAGWRAAQVMRFSTGAVHDSCSSRGIPAASSTGC